jgi:hypothetical protein
MRERRCRDAVRSVVNQARKAIRAGFGVHRCRLLAGKRLGLDLFATTTRSQRRDHNDAITTTRSQRRNMAESALRD